MDFLNHKKGRVFFNRVFLLSHLQCTVRTVETVRLCLSLKKKKYIKAKLKRYLILNNKEENSSDFCLYFVQEFGLFRKGCMGGAGGGGGRKYIRYASGT
jgi:hypothetical protein